MTLLLGAAVQRLFTRGQHHYLRTNQRHRHPDSTPAGWSQGPGHRARLLNPIGNPGMPKLEGECCNPLLLVDLTGLPWKTFRDSFLPPPKEICLTWVISGDWKLLQTPLYDFCCPERHWMGLFCLPYLTILGVYDKSYGSSHQVSAADTNRSLADSICSHLLSLPWLPSY